MCYYLRGERQFNLIGHVIIIWDCWYFSYNLIRHLHYAPSSAAYFPPTSLDGSRTRQHGRRSPRHVDVSRFPVSFVSLSTTSVPAPLSLVSQVRWHVDPLHELCSCRDRQSLCDPQPHHIRYYTSKIQVGLHTSVKCISSTVQFITGDSISPFLTISTFLYLHNCYKVQY